LIAGWSRTLPAAAQECCLNADSDEAAWRYEVMSPGFGARMAPKVARLKEADMAHCVGLGSIRS
jgi:hypothetical protein